MERVRKTYKEKLRPTPTQERQLEAVLWRCRTLYNAALEQGITWWRRGQGVSATRFQQEAELKAIREAYPEDAAIHSHVLQDVLARLDKTYQAFFHRVANGEKAGFPRYQGRTRSHSFTSKEYGNGARLDNGYLVLAKIGRIAVRWCRPVVGSIKTVTVSKEADGWYVCCSCADVPIQPLPPTGQETGIDLGLESFATLADGTQVENPRQYRTAERELKKAQRRVSRRKKGSTRRRKAARCLRGSISTCGGSGATSTTNRRSRSCGRNDTIYHEDLQTANMLRNHYLAKSIADAGWSAIPEHPRLQGSMCRSESGSRAAGLYLPACSGCGVIVSKGLSVRWHSCPELRHEPASRPQRREEYPMARTAPSGSPGGSWGAEPRTWGL